MEKCSFCVQRISRAQRDAKRENRLVRDGEIETACQEACPTDALVFGNLEDPESRASKMKADRRSYTLLDATINTDPNVVYLARVEAKAEAAAAQACL